MHIVLYEIKICEREFISLTVSTCAYLFINCLIVGVLFGSVALHSNLDYVPKPPNLSNQIISAQSAYGMLFATSDLTIFGKSRRIVRHLSALFTGKVLVVAFACTVFICLCFSLRMVSLG